MSLFKQYMTSKMIPMNNKWQQSTTKFNLYSHAENMEPQKDILYNLVLIHQQPPQKADFPLEKFTNFMCLLYFALATVFHHAPSDTK